MREDGLVFTIEDIKATGKFFKENPDRWVQKKLFDMERCNETPETPEIPKMCSFGGFRFAAAIRESRIESWDAPITWTESLSYGDSKFNTVPFLVSRISDEWVKWLLSWDDNKKAQYLWLFPKDKIPTLTEVNDWKEMYAQKMGELLIQFADYLESINWKFE